MISRKTAKSSDKTLFLCFRRKLMLKFYLYSNPGLRRPDPRQACFLRELGFVDGLSLRFNLLDIAPVVLSTIVSTALSATVPIVLLTIAPAALTAPFASPRLLSAVRMNYIMRNRTKNQPWNKKTGNIVNKCYLFLTFFVCLLCLSFSCGSFFVGNFGSVVVDGFVNKSTQTKTYCSC